MYFNKFFYLPYRGITHPPLPPPPYSEDNHAQVATVESAMSPRASPHVHPPLQRKYSPVCTDGIRSDSPQSNSSDGRPAPVYSNDNGAPPLPPTGKFIDNYQDVMINSKTRLFVNYLISITVCSC